MTLDEEMRLNELVLAVIRRRPGLRAADIVRAVPGFSESAVRRKLFTLCASGPAFAHEFDEEDFKRYYPRKKQGSMT